MDKELVGWADSIVFYAELVAISDKDIFVSDGEEEFWLPINEITFTKVKGSDYEITVPKWLAKKKGII